MYTSADVTVYIVCNGSSPLLRCFDGLLAQTSDPARILIIDNGCCPGVVVEDYIRHHLSCPVDIVRLDEPVSTAAARNRAVELCNTPLLAGLAPHVVPSPDWLELMTNAIVPRCHCLAEKAEHVCGVGGKTDFLCRTVGHEQPPRNYGEQALDNVPYLWSGNAIYKTAVLREAGGYPESEDEDAALGERLRKQGKLMLYVPGIVAAEI